MEGTPKTSILSAADQVLYKNVTANPRFADITEEDFKFFRNAALSAHPAEAHNFTSLNGVMMEKTPTGDELKEVLEDNNLQ